MKTITPDSENVKSASYDASKKTLTVEFHSGTAYQYKNISTQKFTAFATADSIGAYAATRLKNGKQVK